MTVLPETLTKLSCEKFVTTLTKTGSMKEPGVPHGNRASDDLSMIEGFLYSFGSVLTSFFSRLSSDCAYSRWLVALSILLGFSGALFYSLIYYQEKMETLEKEVLRYEFVKTVTNSALEVPAVSRLDEWELHQKNLLTRRLYLAKKDMKHSDRRQVPVTEHKRPLENDSKLTLVHDEYSISDLNASVTRHDLPTDISENPDIKNVTEVSKPIFIENHEIELTLKDAYKAFEAGLLEYSQKKFIDVLGLDSKNIIAIIGLGILEASKGQDVTAMRYYQDALAMEPDNLEIYRAISSLAAQLEPYSDGHHVLKELVNAYPSSANLQNILGNTYATSQDWVTAQLYFFNAYSLEAGNPEFTINLAISLDQLGQYSLAAQYYAQALSLVESSGVSNSIGDVTDIKHRLSSIRQFIEGRS